MTDRLTIIQGDCRDELKKLPTDSWDACVTDPPYHLTTGKKGGTGIASLELGRRAILIDLEANHIKIATQRCDVTPGLPL